MHIGEQISPNLRFAFVVSVVGRSLLLWNYIGANIQHVYSFLNIFSSEIHPFSPEEPKEIFTNFSYALTQLLH